MDPPFFRQLRFFFNVVIEKRNGKSRCVKWVGVHIRTKEGDLRRPRIGEREVSSSRENVDLNRGTIGNFVELSDLKAIYVTSQLAQSI